MIDRIAAGEVIDGPYSAVKELIENSLDAGASSIRISTGGAGLDYIIIEDDGYGIDYNELDLALEKHATSKIENLDDISCIRSFGFRGEALASIASISHLTIRSVRRGADTGGMIESRGGVILSKQPEAVSHGTIIEVRDLFYATPVRKKFLKSEKGENQKTARTVLQSALANPEVRFIYKRDNKEFYNFPPATDALNRWTAVYGIETEKKMIPVDFEREGLRISGFISVPEFYKSSRDAQFSFVNRRSVEIKNLTVLVRKCYGDSLPAGAHPYFVLFFDIDPERIDVNVHPGKKEIRFINESQLQGAVITAVSAALRNEGPVNFSNIRNSGYTLHPGAAHNQSNLSRSHDSFGGLGFSEFNLRESSQVYEINTYADETADRDNMSGERDDFSNYSIGNSDGAFTDLTFSSSSSGTSSSSSSNRKSIFLPRRHFGIIFGTYILAESDDAFFIIDQHTAHERINFERIKTDILNRKGERQPLLSPISIQLPESDLERILEHRDIFHDNGFEIEEFGQRTLLIREVPFYIESGLEEEVFLHLADRIMDGDSTVDLYKDYAALKACRSSVKRNDYVSGESLSRMLEQLSQCEDPSRCPHGRPTMIRLTREDLDKMFLRIKN
jgi:DNA mismatch repair protein MutL